MRDRTISARFGHRLKVLRTAQSMSMRELAAKSGVSHNTICRSEAGHGVFLDAAVPLAEALGATVAEMIAPFGCGQCLDMPPAGFTCNACQATGTEAAS